MLPAQNAKRPNPKKGKGRFFIANFENLSHSDIIKVSNNFINIYF